MGVVGSTTTNQVRIDFTYLLARVNIVIDGTKGTFFAYIPALKNCIAQSVSLKNFTLSTFVDGFNMANQASSFLVAIGSSTKVPFNSKDSNLYYRYNINQVTEVTGQIYIGLFAFSFYFYVAVDPSVIPRIPSIPVGSRNITISIPTSFVAQATGSSVAAKIYNNTFSVGGCTL